MRWGFRFDKIPRIRHWYCEKKRGPIRMHNNSLLPFQFIYIHIYIYLYLILYNNFFLDFFYSTCSRELIEFRADLIKVSFWCVPPYQGTEERNQRNYTPPTRNWCSIRWFDSYTSIYDWRSCPNFHLETFFFFSITILTTAILGSINKFKNENF
jgi:hypothetical protein